ncbi:MAG TPA: 2-polyprenyl-3-methyl-6-methoxy-1,4-benzoquinone monooxygenase, partial [Pseudomonadales bacterium]|nr:2-polyprenyl-3-methyl-6-methoxy-1,4-benzoquinone monooxygenase [Pseudomonadales bacterium]
MNRRRYSLFDQVIANFDLALRTVAASAHADRPTPGADAKPTLDETEQRHVAGLMRINHSGEVSAQALYHGQSLTARLPQVRSAMEQAAREEVDHLAWCEERLKELNAHTSYLNPIWYAMSFSIGAFAGWVGDKWSLGFVAETEKQVCEHLDSHLNQLPRQDKKSAAILKQMKMDEAHH